MKYNLLFLILVFIVAGCAQSSSDNENNKPNILFFIMDDASIYMSTYGYDWSQTAAIDKIAENGVLFNNAFTPNAKCAPSRSSVLTGRNSWQFR